VANSRPRPPGSDHPWRRFPLPAAPYGNNDSVRSPPPLPPERDLVDIAEATERGEIVKSGRRA